MKGKELRTRFDELTTFKAAEDSRRLSIPAPDKYEVKLPADFKAPEGLSFELKPDDPLIAPYRALAHESGLSQEQFSKGLSLIASVRVGEQQAVQNAKAAEVAKLGANGPARFTAVETFWKGILGSEQAGKAMAARIFTAGDVELHEAAMRKFSSQGSAPLNNGNREPVQNGKLTNEQYSALTYSEKLDYARKHQQPTA